MIDALSVMQWESRLEKMTYGSGMRDGLGRLCEQETVRQRKDVFCERLITRFFTETHSTLKPSV